MKGPTLLRYYGKLVDAISFSPELHKYRRDLNARIDMPRAVIDGPRSRSPGLSRWFKHRRISIAEAYLMVVRDLESGGSRDRLRALRIMVDVSFHAKTLDLPLNTARVQLALIKEAVKNRSNSRRQLELLHDFSVSTHGQHQVIRRLLDEHNMIELPETGARLKNLNAGFDEHVHDTASSGRKNPTQLLVDAFIKGMSEITIAYASADSVPMMREAVDAGRIVGIRVSLAIELSAYIAGHRFHFQAMLPQFKNGKEVKRWFDDAPTRLKDVFDGLRKNQRNRVDSVRNLLKYFNENFLAQLNEGFPDSPLYAVPTLRLKDLHKDVPLSIVNRMHLGEYLFSRYKPILFNRVMSLKAQLEKARRAFRRKSLSEWEYRIIEDRYHRLRAEYRDLNPERLRERFFTNIDAGDYQTVFTDLARLKATLSSARCSLKVLHPLEYGFEPAKKLLESSRGLIDRVEVYNMQDTVRRDPEDVLNLARLVNELNQMPASKTQSRYIPVCGSDSTGRSPTIPGMGFIRVDRLQGKFRRRYIKRHVPLPPLVSALIEAGGAPVRPADVAKAPSILSMGKATGPIVNQLGDEAESIAIPPLRVFQYLNPHLVNVMYGVIGFFVAQHFVGTFYAFLWLFITGFRNSIADLVAGRGARLSAWNLKSVNFDNVARSLFWTGFSVPIMSFVKTQFDVLWPLAADGVLYDLAKFFFISMSNGLYLATHNTLRGFDRKVVKANLFRSIIAWPFATLTAPLGNLAGIPSIVQSKIWSDVVAGFIEGGSKYMKVLGLRRRDLEEIVPVIASDEREERYTALLDLLYLYREEPRTQASLATILSPGYKPPAGSKLDAESRICSYDYFVSIVNDWRLDHGLVNFVLSRYTPEAVGDLLDLVSITLPTLRDWLATHVRQFHGLQEKTQNPPDRQAGQDVPGSLGNKRAGTLDSTHPLTVDRVSGGRTIGRHDG